MYIDPKAFIPSTECFTTCPRLFSNILWACRGHSPECLASPECLRAISGIFHHIPRNFSRHSPEYNIPPISRVPHIPRIMSPVPVFLVLYIALYK